MQIFLLIVVGFATIFGFCCGQQTTKVESNQTPAAGQPIQGSQFDEIIVESNLNVRKKPAAAQPQRRTRSILLTILDPSQSAQLRSLTREKRQFGFEPFKPFNPHNNGFGGFQNPVHSSESTADANSHSQGFGPNGFGFANANAHAQGFEVDGPLGDFGASAANTNTNSFEFGPHGFEGAAGLSGSQVYHLPNGHSINVAYSDGFAIGPDGRPTSSNADSVTYT